MKNKISKIISVFKQNVCISHKRCIFSFCLLLLFLILWKSLPKDFSTLHTPIKWAIVIEIILILLISFDVKCLKRVQKPYAFVLLFCTPFMCFYLTEISVGNDIHDLTYLVIGLNYILYLAVFLVIYALFNSVKIAVISGVIISSIFALANSFIYRFRGFGFVTSDIFAISTATNVIRNYKLIFSVQQACVILVALAVILLSIHCEYKVEGIKHRTLLAVVVFGGICLMNVIMSKEFCVKNNLKPYKWERTQSTFDHGAFLDFYAGTKFLSVEQPSQYSKDKAKQIVAQGQVDKGASDLQIETTLDGRKPDVIVIMNESFSDLSIVGPFETDNSYMEHFKNRQKEGVSGYLTVPALGGLTANTEFEFLTGFSYSFLSTETIAFLNYVKENTPNINEWMKEQGYYSIFMHPFDSSGWNRENAYRFFDFDEKYFVDDWINKDYIRNGMISDVGDYKDLIARYESAKKENENIFMFNVTMQNHGGYSVENYEASVHITDMEGTYPQAEQFLTLMHESDTAFEFLLDYFSKQDNPVLICMFGDHLPSVEKPFYDELAARSGDSGLIVNAKKHMTPFIIWSNYGIGKKEFDNISVNYLSILLMEASDLPTNDYMNYLKTLYRMYPVINANGTKNSDGEWLNWNQAQEKDEIINYSIVQYWKLFDQ